MTSRQRQHGRVVRVLPRPRLARVVVVASAACLLAFVAQTGAAAQVSCGQVVTHSLTLEADLVCPLTVGTGLVVGADGITIDLNGHSIAPQFPDTLGVGIDNRAGHDRVTVRDGSIVATSP